MSHRALPDLRHRAAFSSEHLVAAVYVTDRSVHLYPAGKAQPECRADNPRPTRSDRGGSREDPDTADETELITHKTLGPLREDTPATSRYICCGGGKKVTNNYNGWVQLNISRMVLKTFRDQQYQK